ncbi:MAG: GntR family transcriptional regulator [Propionibacteriaceae bacterium]|nr:GntR family transcriptional regulator [Propionibacteriaceae bacterium]
MNPGTTLGVAKDRHAYNLIRQKIMSGEFGPNARLTAAELAGDAGVSIGPVREAIRRLEAEGLVSYRPSVGATVIALDRGELLDTLRTLAILEGAATALAAPLLTCEDIERLEQHNVAMETALADGDIEAVSKHNRAFHKACHSRCPNLWLLELLQKTAERTHVGRRSFFHNATSRPHASLAEHRELLQLIRESAPAIVIEETVRRHKARTIERAKAETY